MAAFKTLSLMGGQLGLLVVVLTVSLAASRSFAQSPATQIDFSRGADALRAGHLDEAADSFSRVIAQDPTFAGAEFNLGLVRFQQNRYDDSAGAFKKALALKPSMKGAHFFLGLADFRSGDLTKAAAELKRETVSDPANADALMWLGVVEIAQNQPKEAVLDLNRAAKLRPNSVDILYHLGKAYMLVSKQTYEQLYTIDPESWRVHEILADSFEGADRLDDAAAECQKAINLRPDAPDLHEKLGEIDQERQKLDDAAEAFHQELIVNPGNHNATYNLAVVAIERSQPETAIKPLEELLAYGQDLGRVHYQLGRARYRVGQFEPAIVDFKFVTASPESVDAETLQQCYYYLSKVYRNNGQPDESRAALETFERLKQHTDAQQKQNLQAKMKKQEAGSHD